MTEVVVGNTDQVGDIHAAVQPVSNGAGQLLRQAREQQQMSVQAVASALKVPVYKLEALEEDRWDVLTDSVFTRSLALSVCRLLRIPSEPVLAGLPKHEAAKLASNPEGINAPFKEKSLRSLMSPTQESGSGNAVKVVAALVIAVAGGAGLYFLPQWQADQSEQGNPASTMAEGTAEEPLFMPQLHNEPQAAPVQEAATAAPLAEAVATPKVEPALPETAPAPAVAEASATAAPVVTAQAAPEAQPAAPANGSVLRFTATGESWVQVRDANNRVVMEKILKAGDVYEETAAGRPLQVVVGNSGVTKLEIDGAAWDLAASAKNNVARFEVK